VKPSKEILWIERDDEPIDPHAEAHKNARSAIVAWKCMATASWARHIRFLTSDVYDLGV